MAILDEGHYKGEVLRWGFFKSSSKGTDGFELVVRVTSQETVPGGDEYEPLDPPVTRSVSLWLSPKSIENTAKDLRSLGFHDKSLKRLDPSHKDAFDLEGKEVFLSVKHEEYQGKQQERVRLIRKAQAIDVDALLAARTDLDDLFAKAAGEAAGEVVEGGWKPSLPDLPGEEKTDADSGSGAPVADNSAEKPAEEKPAEEKGKVKKAKNK